MIGSGIESLSGTTNLKLPRFADLSRIVAELGDDPRYEGLVAIARKATVAQACVGDLAQARTCCEALDALLLSPRKQGTLGRAAMEAALLQSAVVLYARATATGGKKGERGAVQIRHKLAPKQRTDHDALIQIRNRAIAHVAEEPIEGENWHTHELFLVEFGSAWQPVGAVKRFQFHKGMFERLKRQCAVAQTAVITVFHGHLNRLIEAMNAEPVPVEIFERHLFDPIEKFGGIESVSSVLAGRLTGQTSFLTT